MTFPGRDVLDAFRLAGSAVRLPGGEGVSVRVGDVVLKPAGPDSEFAEWLGDIMASIREDGFRVARPLRAATGAWSHGGWTASHVVTGTEPDHSAAPRWLEVVAAGQAFHRALAGVPRPCFLDRRRDEWATGDRVAWQEEKADLLPALRGPYDALTALLGPKPRVRPQLVHGDLTGNVLFAPGLAPAVIDFSPYWRPPAFGEAVVVGDALIWHGAGPRLLREATCANGPGFGQYIARAVIFRLVTTSEHVRTLQSDAIRGSDSAIRTEVCRYERAAQILTDVVAAPHRPAPHRLAP
ncbi:TIGR02569 family protein [Streptomyces longisporoflavus]|uniref:aminoglycoside phosphotransferase n=1 Tax=Streptomyces longisporoflavus TaxID=28044 RepID=UPI00167F15E2|nr:aminoglycoside phosphotransferase [Streptomyces longisporoflavus]GGV25712.1 TIGR02569 family protein [Streptomyces longisporoflavus]